MYIAEFINLVSQYFQKDNAFRKHHRRQDAIDRYELGKRIQEALEKGITVVESVVQPEPTVSHFEIVNTLSGDHYDK